MAELPIGNVDFAGFEMQAGRAELLAIVSPLIRSLIRESISDAPENNEAFQQPGYANMDPDRVWESRMAFYERLFEHCAESGVGVVSKSGSPVGYIVAHVEQGRVVGGPARVAIIDAIGVDPQWRNGMVFMAMVKALRAVADMFAVHSWTASAWAHNRTMLRLLELLGGRPRMIVFDGDVSDVDTFLASFGGAASRD